MQEAKTTFTPAPWVAQFNVMGTPAEAHLIAPVDGGLTDVAWVNPANTESQANANLIAAAPELYEALEALVKDCPTCFDHNCSDLRHQAANAALKKARGE